MTSFQEKSTQASQGLLNHLSPSRIIQSAPTALAIIDSNGIVLEQNVHFENLFPKVNIDSNFQEKIFIRSQKESIRSFIESENDSYERIITIEDNSRIVLYINRIKGIKSDLFIVNASMKYHAEEDDIIQQLIDSIPDCIYIKDLNSKYTLANNLQSKILGAKSCKTIIGNDDFTFLTAEQATHNFEEEQQIIKTGESVLNKKERLVIDNEVRWFSITKIPLHNDRNQRIAILGIGRDVTEHILEIESLEKAWQEAEKADRLKSNFLANLSHEIRTPLNGILGFSQFLKQKTHSVEKQHKYLDIIHNNGKTLLVLLNDIIDISMIESNQVAIKKQLFRVNGLIAHLHTNFCHQIEDKKLDIELITTTDLPDDKDLLFSDDFRLHQVLGNLIGNAIKFTKQGSIEYGYRLKDDILEFFVSDTGIGIPKEHQLEIFERFRQADDSVTRKYGGTGLGLSISKGLIEMLGGKIWLESKPGKGSKFIFSIPYKNTVE